MAKAEKKSVVPGFTTGEWGGVMHYGCAACPFDTFGLTEMLNHLVDAHDSEPALAVLLSAEDEVKNAKNDIG